MVAPHDGVARRAFRADYEGLVRRRTVSAIGFALASQAKDFRLEVALQIATSGPLLVRSSVAPHSCRK